MGCQIKCQSGAWVVLTQYLLTVTAITFILLSMLTNSGGKTFTTVKKPAKFFTSLRYGNHLKVQVVLFMNVLWNGNKVKKI